MDPRVFTRRSSVGALVTAVLVAVALGQLVGARWGLAAVTGLPAGAGVLGVSFAARNGLFRMRPRPWGPVPWAGAWFVGYLVATLPALTLGAFLELNWATKATIQLMLLLSGLTGLMFGYIVRMLERLDTAEEPSGTSPSSETPQPADQHSGS